MFERLAIWYLRKKERSVLIGYELDGGLVKCLNDSAYIYDNHIRSIDFRCVDNTPFLIPVGEFDVDSASLRKYRP